MAGTSREEREMAQARLVNGVDVDALKEKADALKQNPALAGFHFRTHTEWLGCGHSRTTVTEFYGVGEDIAHDRPFVLEADEPHILLGTDEGANPVEHLLHALVTCLTGAMVYHAAIRGIEIQELEADVEGDLDVRGFMGLDPKVRKGYQNIRVTFRAKSDASAEKLAECARFSPVLDVVMNGTNVDLKIETV
jgi:uncharacterized OsmC-like protein